MRRLRDGLEVAEQFLRELDELLVGHATASNYDPLGPVPSSHKVAEVVGRHLFKALDGAEQGVAERVTLVGGGMQEFG